MLIQARQRRGDRGSLTPVHRAGAAGRFVGVPLATVSARHRAKRLGLSAARAMVLESKTIERTMVTMTNFERVRQFHERFGHPVATVPAFPDSPTLRYLRVDLIREEFAELQTAEVTDDLAEVADALTDMLYVIYGMGHVYGIDLDKCFQCVHESNMAKLGPDGKPIVRADGKIMKPDGWKKHNLAAVLGIE